MERAGSTGCDARNGEGEFAFRSRRTTGNKISRQTKFRTNIDSGRIADAKREMGKKRDRGRDCAKSEKIAGSVSWPSESNCRLCKSYICVLFPM